MKILSVIAILSMALTIAACGSSSDSTSTTTHVATTSQLNAQWGATINDKIQTIATGSTSASIKDAACTIIDPNKGAAICKAVVNLSSGYQSQTQTFYWNVKFNTETGKILAYTPRNG